MISTAAWGTARRGCLMDPSDAFHVVRRPGTTSRRVPAQTHAAPSSRCCTELNVCLGFLAGHTSWRPAAGNCQLGQPHDPTSYSVTNSDRLSRMIPSSTGTARLQRWAHDSPRVMAMATVMRSRQVPCSLPNYCTVQYCIVDATPRPRQVMA